MSLLISSQPNKPNRLDSEKYPNKDTNKEYHLNYAKWAITSSQTSQHASWLARIKINKEFYKGDQWTFDEDIETFLNDGTGQVRNRIKMVHNTIRPMVEQFRGNASILKINATAKSISKLSVNRRDLALSVKLFETDLAREFPGLGNIMKANDAAIGENIQETTQIFENLYVDMYVKQMNSLMKYVKELNDLDKTQIKSAQNLALSGLVAMEAFEHGGHQRYREIESEDFFWDTDARRLDLTDAAYMGYVNPMDVSMILERYQLNQADAQAIEAYASTSNDTTAYADTANTREYKTNRMPVYKVFWRDTQRIEYGYVEDEYGYPYLTKINHKEPGEEEPRYTDADLMTPPDSAKNRRLFKKGKKKRLLYLDSVRSCTFIPGEVVGKSQKAKEAANNDKSYDIVLEYGMEDNQETDYYDLSNVKFPIKVETWGYVDGEVFSPLDDAINPQRFINRILSVTEQTINNSGGQSVIIDEDAIDPNSQDQIYADIQQGKPITVRTKGKGVPNTVGNYDATPKAGVYNMFNIIPTIKQMIQDTSGVNEALKGESTGSDQLVGVTELLIQRGSLMQEPFYSAITNLYVQLYQHTATVGKRMYIDNERELAVMIGDEGVEILQMAKDMRNEDFRVFVTRENDDITLKNQANQMLDVFLEKQLIDDKVYANLYNRSTPDDVTMALRSQAGLRIEAARQAAKANAEAENTMASEQEFLEERQRDDTLKAQGQPERINDAQIKGKEDQMITKAVIDEDIASRGIPS